LPWRRLPWYGAAIPLAADPKGVPMKLLLAPLFLQIALTFGLTLALGNARVSAVKSGAVKLSAIALNSGAWPDRIRQIANCYSNQFEQPMLFYVLVILALATGLADPVLIVGAWLFVLSRFCHAYVHVTNNNVLTRFQFFAAGVFILIAMWADFAVRALLR
jgi:hypothetical protein